MYLTIPTLGRKQMWWIVVFYLTAIAIVLGVQKEFMNGAVPVMSKLPFTTWLIEIPANISRAWDIPISFIWTSLMLLTVLAYTRWKKKVDEWILVLLLVGVITGILSILHTNAMAVLFLLFAVVNLGTGLVADDEQPKEYQIVKVPMSDYLIDCAAFCTIFGLGLSLPITFKYGAIAGVMANVGYIIAPTALGLLGILLRRSIRHLKRNKQRAL